MPLVDTDRVYSVCILVIVFRFGFGLPRDSAVKNNHIVQKQKILIDVIVYIRIDRIQNGQLINKYGMEFSP